MGARDCLLIALVAISSVLPFPLLTPELLKGKLRFIKMDKIVFEHASIQIGQHQTNNKQTKTKRIKTLHWQELEESFLWARH